MAIFKKKNQEPQSKTQESNGVNYQSNEKEANKEYLKTPIFENLNDNIDYLKRYQEESWDFVANQFTLENKYQSIKIALFYFAGLVDQRMLNQIVIDALNNNFQKASLKLDVGDDSFNYFKDKVLTMIGVSSVDNFGNLFNTLLSGDMILFIDGSNKAIIIGARMMQERSVEKPISQLSIMGSNDSFNENNLTNISLVRKRIKNPNFIVKNYIIGHESNTNVSIAYLKGAVDENILAEVKKRIEAIDLPVVHNSSSIENAIKEKPFSLFPKFYYTERPESVVSNIYEGRIAIFTDGCPEPLIVPSLFVQFLHSIDDFHQKAILSSFFRILRYLGLLLGLFFPAVYICLILHHSELLPGKLLYSVAGQMKTTPLPAYIELLSVMIAFDILREAGARMPTYLGSSLSFVGAIIIGQSSVEAGLIAPIVVIVAALSGVGTQLITNYKLNIAITLLKYIFTIAAVFIGLLGLTLTTVVLVFHLTTLRSFGVDYFSPYAPFSKEGMKDAVLRFPMSKLFKKNRKKEQYPH